MCNRELKQRRLLKTGRCPEKRPWKNVTVKKEDKKIVQTDKRMEWTVDTGIFPEKWWMKKYQKVRAQQWLLWPLFFLFREAVLYTFFLVRFCTLRYNNPRMTISYCLGSNIHFIKRICIWAIYRWDLTILES